MRFWLFTFTCFSCLALMGCSSQPQRSLQAQQSIPVDFSGSWEMDYGRSDDINAKIASVYRELQRLAQRQSRDPNRYGSPASGIDINRRMYGLINLAKFADMVTESQVLTIEQTERDIEVEREGDFTLNCGFYTDRPEIQHEELGTEVCGWDGHQMIFRLALPDETQVVHRMTIAPDGERLHIATTVAGKGSSAPFTLNRFYYRFEPLPEDYECEYTLTKGQVCRRRSS
jgi:hypothetical protein